MPQPNDVIGPYVVLRCLGQGGFGEVWLAERRSSLLAVQVALKLPLGPAPDPDTLRNEAGIWLRASGHPNVVPVLDAEEYGGQIAIASEYIAGGSLADCLRDKGGGVPALDDAVRIAEGVLAGLVHLHAVGIVHRDLKPENVLLQGGIPRLTDFGLSRVLSGSNISQSLAGSPHYMAPETFSGAYSTVSDLWAAGVILFEMISGRLPFEGSDVMQVIASVREGQRAPLPEETPEAVRAVVDRLLSRSAEERFASAEEALGALRRRGYSTGASSQSFGGAPRSTPSDAPAPSEGCWYVRLMGSLQLRCGAASPDLPTRKSAALLARLAYEPGKEFRREALMEMLWPGATIEQQRNNMSVELHRLRQRLALPGVPGKKVLCGAETLKLEPGYMRSDTDAMQRATEQARAAAQPSERLTLLQEAAALYQPAFLEDQDYDWIAQAREALSRLYLDVAEKLVTEYGRLGEHERAITMAREWIDRDRYAEARHGLLIFALIQAGRPCDALRHYKEMAALWNAEVGAAPGPQARKLGEEAKKRCEAQPVPAMQAASHNGPVLPATFFPILGREQEAARLVTLLQEPDTRLVTLTGAGGTGKTRLAIEAARQLADTLGGAVWFVPLADLTDPVTLLDSLRNTLGIPSVPGTEPFDQVAHRLSEQPSLVLFDNFEHLTECCGDLVERLLGRVTNLTCLVTSRQSLQLPMEVIFEVPPLPLPSTGTSKQTENLHENACVRLFMQRAQRARADFALTAQNAPAIVDLCRRLDGIPLAIELAAAWARMLTPGEMLAQLKQILVSRDRSLSPQHRSLEGVIGASFARLPDALQRFFVHLSAFRGGWTVEAASQVCDEPQALLMLGELQDASLILSYDSGPAMRFRMLEPIREYAEQRLQESDLRAELETRFTRYFQSVASDAAAGLRGPEQANWLRRLEEELPNLRRLFGTIALREQLCAVAGLQRFWVARGYLREGREWLNNALPSLDDVPHGDRGAVTLSAGIMAWMDHDIECARAQLSASLAYCRGQNEDIGVVKALANLANIASEEHDYEVARQEYEACLAASCRLDDPRLTATILGNLGGLCKTIGDLIAAREHIQRALAFHSRFDNALQKADLLYNLADVDYDCGQYISALQNIRNSLAIRHEYGERTHAPNALRQLGMVGMRLGHYAEAVRLYAFADQALRDRGVVIPTGDAKKYADWLAVARANISEETYIAERSEGGKLDAGYALAYALSRAASWLLDAETEQEST